MNRIIGFIRDYVSGINKTNCLAITLFTGLLVHFNYDSGLDEAIRKNSSFPIKLLCWWLVFLVAFGIPYFLTCIFKPSPYFKDPVFLFLIVLAPLLFALKLTLDPDFRFSTNPAWNNYWNHIVYWPCLLVLTSMVLYLLWKRFDSKQPFYGFYKKNISIRPYLILLLLMLPLVFAATTQVDFLSVYPKLKSITSSTPDLFSNWHKLLFEFSYGSDFINIELFFRGFLVLGFLKWFGKDAILPMACFYCTIHFGKPLAECISSYFGGIILGIIVYNTRSIYGGLLIHLGIAWLMEIGGYLGNN